MVYRQWCCKKGREQVQWPGRLPVLTEIQQFVDLQCCHVARGLTFIDLKNNNNKLMCGNTEYGAMRWS